MDALNNKLAGLRDTVKKIKNEIKSFEENESKNFEQRRINTVSNKIARPSSFSKKIPMNKLNKKLMKNYFKFSLKEQNQFCNANTNRNSVKTNNNSKNIYKNILSPQNFSKNNPMSRTSKKLNNRINSKKIISNNGGNDNESKIKYLLITDLNNMNNMTSENENNSCMNKNLFKHLTTNQREYSRKKSGINENKIDEIEKLIMTYSNNDNLKKNIYINNFINSKNKLASNKKDMIYNEYNSFNSNKENDYKNINNSAYYNVERTNINKNIDIKDLLNINNDIEDKTNFNKNFNQSLFQFNGSKLSTTNNSKKTVNKNNSFIGKIKAVQNYTQIANLKKSFKNNNNLSKNDFISNSFRGTFFQNNENLLHDKDLFEQYKNYNETCKNFNLSLRPTNLIPMNNTINYHSKNSSDIDFDLGKGEKIINKKKVRKILRQNPIGDIYIKAKLFEKCGQKNFKNYVHNFCDLNGSINNLKKYKKYLIKLREEENQNKKQINIYQKLCKRILESMNPQEINKIIGEIQNNFIENENDNYIIEQIKSILPY